MKKLLTMVFSLLIVGLVYHYQEPIVAFIMREVVFKYELPEYTNNNYYKNINYNYVSITDNFYLSNENDIKNAIYTILNSGMTSYSLFCEDEYTTCLSDVERIATDYNILGNINNFVHPYNSYDKIYITNHSYGKIDIQIEKLYSDEEINDINNKLEFIKQQIITHNMSSLEKIRAFHDYVINNTNYDIERANELNDYIQKNNPNNSHKANGVLNNHIALCSGYTDLMAIFLSSIGIPNYKIANHKHVWNAVYINNNWYHLDLTWDDPVTSTGDNMLIHDFFLITTSQLEDLDVEKQHQYDKTVYGS